MSVETDRPTDPPTHRLTPPPFADLRYKMTMTLSQLRSIIIARANAIPTNELYNSTLRVGVSWLVALLPLIYKLVRLTDRIQRSPNLRYQLWSCAGGGGGGGGGGSGGGSMGPEWESTVTAVRSLFGDGDTAVVAWWRTAVDLVISMLRGLGCAIEHLVLSTPPMLASPHANDEGDRGVEASSYAAHAHSTDHSTDRTCPYGVHGPRLSSACLTLELAAAAASVAFTLGLAMVVFAALAEAERTLHRRLAYAKFFTALTSTTRARKYQVGHWEGGGATTTRHGRAAPTACTLTAYSTATLRSDVITNQRTNGNV